MDSSFEQDKCERWTSSTLGRNAPVSRHQTNIKSRKSEAPPTQLKSREVSTLNSDNVGLMLKILDCTMRDGGYYNDWDFSIDFARNYLSLMSDLEIDYVEVGFRFLKSGTHTGAWAYSPDTAISAAMPPNFSPKIGVMLNLGEWLESENKISSVFADASRLNFVRLAAHFEELPRSYELVKRLKDLGLEVGVNLMQASERSVEDLTKFGALLGDLGVDFGYVADSLGSLDEDQFSSICRHVLQESSVPIGVHAHNNRGRATSNTISAIRSGALMADCTLMGMGRGAGNSATEDLLMELSQTAIRSVNETAPRALATFNGRFMWPLKSEFGWGVDLEYKLAAFWGIHPTYVQELKKAGKSPEDVVETLQKLREVSANKFESSLISHLDKDSEQSDGDVHAQVTPSLESRRNSSFIIIGSGSSVQNYSQELVSRILSFGLTVLILNDASFSLPHAAPVFRVSASKQRLAEMGESFWTGNAETLVPFALKPESSRPKSSVIPRAIESGSLAARANSVVVPNALSLSFALSVCVFLDAKEIFLAGIDGFDGDARNAELRESLVLAQNKVPITSLTPSKFPVPWVSPYWRSGNP